MTPKHKAEEQPIVIDFTKDKNYIAYNKYLDKLYRKTIQRRKGCKDVSTKG